MKLARSLSTRSLAGRLTLAMFVSVVVAFGVGTAFGLWQEVSRYAAAKRDTLAMAASVFAAAGADATAAGDAIEAGKTLRAIARRPDLVYAAIERPDGSVLADQGLTIRLNSDLDLDGEVSITALLTSMTVQVRVPVLHFGRPVGHVVLVADTTDLSDRLTAVIQASLIGSGAALTFGLLIAFALQRSITRPIAALAATMEQVRRGQDYSLAARIDTNDEVGALAGTFNSLLDTVRDRDARLARHREHLEEEVADRTADLREARVVADNANAAKSSFLATMSHEIRTPLNGMLVMAELLAAASLPDRQKRYAEVIARSGQSLLAIINDILDFAKVESGKLDLEKIPVEPGQVVDTVVALFGEKAREAGLDLAAYVAPELPRSFLGDPVRLGQILSNLVNNALKFTAEGSVLVRWDATREGTRISVADTGIGIAPEKLRTIFTAFSQADQSTTRQYGGTGLGLSIAQRLVGAMGGAMRVESEVGRGTTFFVDLPLARIEGVKPQPILRQPHALGSVILHVRGAATRLALGQRLVTAGFDVVEDATNSVANAHWIGDAEDIQGSARPAGPGQILAIARMGDAAAARIKQIGRADQILRWPVRQEELDTLLAALAAGKPLSDARAERGQAIPQLPQFPTARVLVVDDSSVNREVAIEALATCGVVDVTVAEDGRQAVDAVCAGSFDLVLMDGSMPVLDGYEAARAIRSWEIKNDRPRLPIVALTAHVVGTAASAWQEAGMDAALTKPFTLASLATILSDHLLTARLETAKTAATLMGSAPPEDERGSERDIPLLDENVVAGIQEMSAVSGSDFAGRIFGLYRQHAPAALAELHSAIAEISAPRVASAAHSLKSMSLNVGASALAASLNLIEAAAREQQVCPDAACARDLEELLLRSCASLETRLSTSDVADGGLSPDERPTALALC